MTSINNITFSSCLPHSSFRRLTQHQRTTTTMDASCACGAVKFTTSSDKPIALFHCHCIDCQKQSASAFGTSAIFPFFSVANDPSVTHFIKNCDSGRKKRCYFCSKCGSRILHTTIMDDRNPKTVSVKGGLIEGLDWKGGIHIWCSRAVIPIPEGVERWDKEPGEK